jgi:hypothetical protein
MNLPKLLHLNQTIKAYGYDANGNRERATIDGSTITASYTLTLGSGVEYVPFSTHFITLSHPASHRDNKRTSSFRA